MSTKESLVIETDASYIRAHGCNGIKVETLKRREGRLNIQFTVAHSPLTSDAAIALYAYDTNDVYQGTCVVFLHMLKKKTELFFVKYDQIYPPFYAMKVTSIRLRVCAISNFNLVRTLEYVTPDAVTILRGECYTNRDRFDSYVSFVDKEIKDQRIYWISYTGCVENIPPRLFHEAKTNEESFDEIRRLFTFLWKHTRKHSFCNHQEIGEFALDMACFQAFVGDKRLSSEISFLPKSFRGRATCVGNSTEAFVMLKSMYMYGKNAKIFNAEDLTGMLHDETYTAFFSGEKLVYTFEQFCRHLYLLFVPGELLMYSKTENQISIHQCPILIPRGYLEEDQSRDFSIKAIRGDTENKIAWGFTYAELGQKFPSIIPDKFYEHPELNVSCFFVSVMLVETGVQYDLLTDGSLGCSEQVFFEHPEQVTFKRIVTCHCESVDSTSFVPTVKFMELRKDWTVRMERGLHMTIPVEYTEKFAGENEGRIVSKKLSPRSTAYFAVV